MNEEQVTSIPADQDMRTKLDVLAEQVNQFNDRLQSLPALIESELDKRELQKRDDVKREIETALQDYSTTKQMQELVDETVRETVTGVTNAFKAEFVSFREYIETIVHPMQTKVFDMDSQIRHQGDHLSLLQKGHNDQQNLISKLTAQFELMHSGIIDINNGLFGSGASLGLLQQTTMLKTRADASESKVSELTRTVTQYIERQDRREREQEIKEKQQRDRNAHLIEMAKFIAFRVGVGSGVVSALGAIGALILGS